ncbi:MAG: methyltransferase domain-containing protein [Pseudonocardiaceae bacterium]
MRTAALDALEEPAHSFDSAFSINVNLFWTRSPTRELENLHRMLRPGGTLHVCFVTALGRCRGGARHAARGR